MNSGNDEIPKGRQSYYLLTQIPAFRVNDSCFLSFLLFDNATQLFPNDITHLTILDRTERTFIQDISLNTTQLLRLIKRSDERMFVCFSFIIRSQRECCSHIFEH